MPRFFLDLYDDMVVMDSEGMEFPGAAAAHERALASAREMACAEMLNGELDLKHRIEVRDESGAVLATVRFGDAVEVRS